MIQGGRAQRSGIFFIVFVRAGDDAAIFKAEVGAVGFVGLEASLFDQRPELRRAAVDELRAELDGFVPSRMVWMRPPVRDAASSTVTDRPASARARAAVRPAMPAPMMTTSLITSLMDVPMKEIGCASQEIG